MSLPQHRFLSRRAAVPATLIAIALLASACGGAEDDDNHAPTAATATVTTAEDTASSPVTPVVTDADKGDTFTFSVTVQPLHGSAAVVGNKLVYTPAANYNGSDSFTFRATDHGGLAVSGAASVTVTAVNDTPTGATATLTTTEDTASAPVTPSVTDPDVGDTYTFSVVTQPAHGTATVVGNALVYTPAASYIGSDSFTFAALEIGSGASVTGTANVAVLAVNHAPLATGGDRAVFADSFGLLTPWVDDVDPGDTFSFQLEAPANARASLVGNQLKYTPGPATTPPTTTDSFAFRSTDAAGTSTVANARVRVYDSAALGRCKRNSTLLSSGALDVRTRSNDCAFFGATSTRTATSGADIVMDYFDNRPSLGTTPIKGVVVMIGGGDFTMSLDGDLTTGVAGASGGGNYVVRTAQLVADAGYIVVSLDKPTDLPLSGTQQATTESDVYRLSVRHAVDILQVLKHLNLPSLDVYLVGTSRGAMSVVAQNRIASAIALSSPVTLKSIPAQTFVGDPDFPAVMPSAVQRPAWIGWHLHDECFLSTPANSQLLADKFSLAGVATTPSTVDGGVKVTLTVGTVTNDPCGAFVYHGFLGIETTAVGALTTWLDAQVAARGTNHRPDAAYGTYNVARATSRQIDLSRLARDADGDTLTYTLSHTATTLGGTVSISGSTVTYNPPAALGNIADRFVYIVTDGKGGVGSAVVTVQIAP